VLVRFHTVDPVGRVVSAVSATVTVAFYTSVAMFVLLMQSGFED
jgi:uncharacterized protein YqfA (UPF0365 family)